MDTNETPTPQRIEDSWRMKAGLRIIARLTDMGYISLPRDVNTRGAAAIIATAIIKEQIVAGHDLSKSQ